MATGRGAYVVSDDGWFMWISTACKNTLLNAGAEQVETRWNQLITNERRAVGSAWCSALEEILGGATVAPQTPPASTTSNVALMVPSHLNTSSKGGFAIVNNEDWIWVNAACKNRLLAAGTSKTISTYTTINSRYDRVPSSTHSCDELVAMTSGGSSSTDGRTSSFVLNVLDLSNLDLNRVS